MRQRLIMFFISIVGIIFIVSISRSIITLWQRGSIVAERQVVLSEVEEKHEALKDELEEVKSPAFIEKQAREKLNLQKEGEIVVVLPKPSSKKAVEGVSEPQLANWQKWWRLFF